MTIRIKQISSDFVYEAGPSIGLPIAVGGSNTSIQFNDGGEFGGDSFFTYDKSQQTLTVTEIKGSLKKLSDGVTDYLQAGSNITLTSNVDGSITISSTGGTGSPAGSDKQVQFNDGGVVFGASANLSFDSSSNTLSLTGIFDMDGNIIPTNDSTNTLGTADKRWAHVYTGDLHLRNDRGDWTIVEEKEYLCVVNNLTGKKYKMMLELISDES